MRVSISPSGSFIAISGPPSPARLLEAGASRAEGKVKGVEQCPRLVVVFRRGAHDDVHAPDVLGLVEVDLGENDVFFQTDRVIAAAVETLRVQPAKVSN